MALPTLVNSYEFDTNWLHTSSGNDYTDRRYIWLHVVQTMLNWPTNPWTVAASCNGSTAGTPGPGWNSIADIVYGAQRSWILLESVGGQQMLFSLDTSQDYDSSVYFSPDGNLTGGTTTTLPLTGNYRSLIINAYMWFAGITSATTYTHMLHATNGELDIIFNTYGGDVWQCILFGKVADAIAEWTQPWVARSEAAWVGSTPDEKCDYQDGSHGWGRVDSFRGLAAPLSGNSINGVVMPEGANNVWISGLLPLPSDITGKYPMFPLMFFLDDPGEIGAIGRIDDIYLISTSSLAVVTGDTLEENPASPTREWIVMHDFAFPWDGSTPIIG